MKKQCVFFVVTLMAIAGCSEDREVRDDVLVHRMQYFAPGEDEPFNGERMFYYNSDTLRSKAKYVRGYPEQIINFYPTGEKRHEFIYKRDELISRTTWYRSGQKKFERADNMIREWYENGQLKTEVHYLSEGILHGITKVWYRDGTLKGSEHYSHGKLDGKRVKRDSDGNIILTQVYDKGMLVKSFES